MYFNKEKVHNSVVETCQTYQKKAKRYKRSLFFSALVLFLFYLGFVVPPSQFPVGTLISIEEGMILSEVSALLEEENVIKSPLLFESFVILSAGDGGILSGDYFFEERHSAWEVVGRMTSGEYGLTPVRVTLPEGATVAEMAQILEEAFPEFDATIFVSQAQGDEGFLFPDTYFFLPNIQAEQVHRELKENFTKKVAEIESEFHKTDSSLRDIIIMASLLEEEARTTETRRMISGILWERINIGMRLQVDAVFPYINGKNTFQLSLEDLKVDSPYNTYKYAGLPAGPISNPGIDSILAALNPKESPYLFYLSDMSGAMHYARDFEEHKRNKFRYLR